MAAIDSSDALGAAPALARYLSTLQAEAGPALVGVVLYGSVARGEQHPGSDIDLLVVVDRDVGRGEQLAARAIVAMGNPAPPISPLVVDRDGLAAHPWVLVDVATDGQVLLDPTGVVRSELEAVRRRLRDLGSRRVRLPDGSWYWMLKPDAAPGEEFFI